MADQFNNYVQVGMVWAPAEAKGGDVLTQGRQVVAIGENDEECNNLKGALVCAVNKVAGTPLEGTTGAALVNTDPALYIEYVGSTLQIVLRAIDIIITNTPGALPRFQVCWDSTRRRASGGVENTNLVRGITSGQGSSLVKVWESQNANHVVVSAGAGNPVANGACAAVAGTRLRLIVPGQLILAPVVGHCIMVYAFAGTTGPQFDYTLRWAERA